MRMRESERGSTLVIVVVLVTVLLVAGAAMVKLSGVDVEESRGQARAMRLRYCARAARQVVMSQLRFTSNLPKTFKMVVLDPTVPGPTPTDPLQGVVLDLRQGHDPAGTSSVIDAVQLIDSDQLGAGKSPLINGRYTNDITLRSMSSASAAIITARCRDHLGRTIEIEMQIKYGLGG